MNILLIRHADAVPREGNTLPDEERPLTEEGKTQCRTLAEALKRRGVDLGKVVTSPLLRARQTAEGLLEHWSEPKPELLICNALAPEGKDKKRTRFIRGLDTDRVTLIGHSPDLNEFAAWLIGSRKSQVQLAKAGAALIECEAGPYKGGGILAWLVTPVWY
jgi:phosphohistidine phosphatase